MPASNSTKAKVEMRVNRIARLLSNGATRSECVQYGSNEWGIGARQVDKYIHRARELLRADWEMDRQTMVAELLSQCATLQKEARKQGNLNAALGCINSAARLARIFD